MKVDGKTALVTGATGGLGRAIARTLAAREARIVLSSRKTDELDELAESLPGGGHTTVVCDLADEDAALTLLEKAGDIDVLVANAALPGGGRAWRASANTRSAARFVSTSSRLCAWPAGHFVFVSSMSGIAAAPRASLYGATKFGIRGFALNLREDLRGSGIGVSHITPGMIRQAGMFADSGAAPSAALGTSTPEQVANAVVRAIERNKSEIRVAPLRQQAVTRFGMLAPEIFGRLAGPSAARTMDAMAAGLADKR